MLSLSIVWKVTWNRSDKNIHSFYFITCQAIFHSFQHAILGPRVPQVTSCMESIMTFVFLNPTRQENYVSLWPQTRTEQNIVPWHNFLDFSMTYLKIGRSPDINICIKLLLFSSPTTMHSNHYVLWFAFSKNFLSPPLREVLAFGIINFQNCSFWRKLP